MSERVKNFAYVTYGPVYWSESRRYGKLSAEDKLFIDEALAQLPTDSGAVKTKLQFYV
jgi:hypothetical protein